MKTTGHIAFHLLLIFIVSFIPQNAMALMATPMQFNLNLTPGEKATKSIEVTHTGTRPMSLTVSIKDFYYDRHGEKQESDPGIIAEGLGGFLKVSPMKLEIKPGESKLVNFTATIPSDAPGGHWSTIYITQTNKPKPTKVAQGKSGLEIFAFFRVAIRVTQFDISVKEKKGHISDMEIEFDNKTDRHVVVMAFENDTTNIMRCKGNVEILNEDGEKVATIPLYKRGAFTAYPYRPRITRTLIQKKLLPGTYTALAMIDFDAEDLVAGELEFEVNE